MAALALTVGVARAEQPAGGTNKEQAARLAAEAEAHGKKQQFADALRKYKEAAKLDPSTPAYQCNIGMAYYALGDEARAHLYFGRCYQANHAWPSENVENVFNYVVGVLGKQDYTPLKISGTPENAEVHITLYAEEGPLVAPVTVYLPFSNYEIEIRADGHESKTIPVEASNRNEKSIIYSLSPAPAHPGGDDSGGPGAGGGNLVGSGGEVDKQVDTGGRKKWPLVLAGGGALAAVGGYFAFRAAEHKQDLLCDLTIEKGNCEAPLRSEAGIEEQADDYKGAMRTREILAYSLWGVGAAAIGAGLVLYFTQSDGDQSSSSVSVGAAPAPGGGMVTLSLFR
jgi:hypothetical protein